MILLNREQYIWVSKNFGLTKRDLPTNFYTSKEIILIISGKSIFDKEFFVNDCLKSF